MKRNKFIDIFNILSIVGLVITVLWVYLSHGEYFRRIFFYDQLDFGMDFFHSIEYTLGRSPYDVFQTLYPPLANMFFFFLLHFVPEGQYSQWTSSFSESIMLRGSHYDLRVWQPTMLLFLFFVIIVSVLIFGIVYYSVKEYKGAFLFAFNVLFSYVIIYSFERGNIILVSVIFALLFLLLYESDNVLIKELSIICLAISAGLKLYPAILGMLLIYKKDWLRAVRAMIYGVAAFILPFLFFEEKLDGLKIFINQLVSFSLDKNSNSFSGLSASKIVNSVLYFFGDNDIFVSGKMEMILNLLVALICLIAGFILKDKWKKAMACILAMILIQNQGLYIAAFLIIPLVLLIKENEDRRKSDFVALVFMASAVVFFPGDLMSDNPILSMGRFQFCIAALFIGLVFDMAYNVFFKGER